MSTKIKSFTLSELLVVMIITAIVVGMAFSVLRLVQKQISSIQKNYEKSSKLSLFEQKIWQDFNEYNEINYNEREMSLVFQSEADTVKYAFSDEYIIREKDTVKVQLRIEKLLFQGKIIKEGNVDAITISGEKELPEYKLFVFKQNDLTQIMNQ